MLAPKITEFSDYHRYLREFYEFKKTQNPRFSFRRFAQMAELKSSNFLMLVMDRKRKLSPATAENVARAMKLSRNETDFFVALVRSERASTPGEREQAEKARKVAVKKIITKDLPADKAEYLSHWYYPLVRELAFLRDFEPRAEWIATRLGGMISLEQAESAIRVLVNLGLWKKVGKRIEVSDLFLDTGSEERTFGEINVAAVHKQTLLAWAKILETLPKSERELGLINIPINESKIPELKARIQKFQDEIIGWLQDEKSPDRLVQLGTYLVPVGK